MEAQRERTHKDDRDRAAEIASREQESQGGASAGGVGNDALKGGKAVLAAADGRRSTEMIQAHKG